ncbi:MAG: M4 family metallopeptidase [candidate division Zixibacteria bacterium]|nr:M4 family metallopeptidase [candidate division Zixibacteria bacterium]
MKQFNCFMLMCILFISANNCPAQTINVDYYLSSGGLWPIDADVEVYVRVSCTNANVWIADLNIPLATNNTYITSRNGGILTYPLSEWDSADFKTPNNNTPAGYTNQTLFGWARLAPPYDDNPYLHPSEQRTIASFYIHTVNNSNLVGQVVQGSVMFRSAVDPTGGPINFGDTLGGGGYPNIQQTFHSVTFQDNQVCISDNPRVGTGTSVKGYNHDHVDCYCYQGEVFILRDLSRCSYFSPHHGHGGGGLVWPREIGTSDLSSPTQGYVSNFDTAWTSFNVRPGVDANVYAGLTYDVLNQDLLRNGIDGSGMEYMMSMVNDTLSLLWCGAGYSPVDKSVHYGLTGTPYIQSLAGCFDIVAHEWAHGVTDHGSQLSDGVAPYWESGALNESFSDMFGAYASSVQMPNSKIWRHSEGFRTDDTTLYLRNIAFPDSANLPAIYGGSNWYSGANSDSATHINCGVPDKMFYLLSQGGSNTGNHNGITVDGIGIEDAMKVMFKANTDNQYWSSNSDFFDGRVFSIGAALELESNFGDFSFPTADAWTAVGIYDTTCSYITGNCNTTDSIPNTITDLVFMLNVWNDTTSYSASLCYKCLNPISGDSTAVALDFNGDCQFGMGDIIRFIAILGRAGDPAEYCPFYYPGP